MTRISDGAGDHVDAHFAEDAALWRRRQRRCRGRDLFDPARWCRFHRPSPPRPARRRCGRPSPTPPKMRGEQHQRVRHAVRRGRAHYSRLTPATCAGIAFDQHAGGIRRRGRPEHRNKRGAGRIHRRPGASPASRHGRRSSFSSSGRGAGDRRGCRSAACSRAARSAAGTLRDASAIFFSTEGQRFGRQVEPVEARGQCDHGLRRLGRGHRR